MSNLLEILGYDENRLHMIRNDATLNYKYQKILHFFDKDFDRACREDGFEKIFQMICKKIKIEVSDSQFVYFLDFRYIMDITRGYRYGNLTPDYQTFLSCGLSQMKYSDDECGSKFCHDYNIIVDSIILLTKRIAKKLYESKPQGYKEKYEWFLNMEGKPAETFMEAMQRILFVNQIMWQSDHRLVGIGNVDSLLEQFYQKDLKEGRLTQEDIRKAIISFYTTLHDNYWFKSNMLMGDTGQILILGKSDIDGNFKYNDLTIYFIEEIEKLQLPDPKVLLRVNKNTPQSILRTALKCMATGIGAPLLSNDDAVIPRLIDFGIPAEDAVNYMTAACWEPLIGGKSSALNNMTSLNYMKGMDFLIKRENLEKITSFDEFKRKYLQQLGRNLNAVKGVIKRAKFQYDPILSVFIQGCKEQKKDVSMGGAIYKNVGITSVGLSNVVNALLNIKEFVYEKKELTLLDVKKLLLSNFEGMPELPEKLKNRDLRFGVDDEEVVSLTNEILHYTTEQTSDFHNYQGGRLKFGVSAPVYVDAAKDFSATFDGRRYGEPFNVHISNEKSKAYTEIINFASMLDYNENRFNGNVVDFMVSPDFINNNFEKFLQMLKVGIKKGFFQMQINVISSEILIAAKAAPQDYPNLIVRVWGFSAYFKDLPVEYQDVLIERALRNEGKIV